MANTLWMSEQICPGLKNAISAGNVRALLKVSYSQSMVFGPLCFITIVFDFTDKIFKIVHKFCVFKSCNTAFNLIWLSQTSKTILQFHFKNSLWEKLTCFLDSAALVQHMAFSHNLLEMKIRNLKLDLDDYQPLTYNSSSDQKGLFCSSKIFFTSAMAIFKFIYAKNVQKPHYGNNF